MQARIYSLLLILIFSLSCKLKPGNKTFTTNGRKDIIDFLKKEYKILPEISRFDSFFLNDLHEQRIKLEVDSLISYRLKIDTLKFFPIEVIEYYNRFGYKERESENCYSINLVRNTKTGKIYLDFIDTDACKIIENVCSYASLSGPISKKQYKELSDEDIKSFNEVNSSQVFTENDFNASNHKKGIESFLNDEFRFVKPTRPQLDSLFNSYDDIKNNRWNIELTTPEDLFKYFMKQSKAIKNKNNYGNENMYLSYLKEQVGLLVIKLSEGYVSSTFMRIYKNDHRLKVREILIYGTGKAGFTYFINERAICFF